MTIRKIILISFLFLNSALFGGKNEWRFFSSATYFTGIANDGKFRWIGSNRGLFKIGSNPEDNQTFNQYNSKLPADIITTVAVDKNGTVFAGTDSGLVKIVNGIFTIINTSNSPLPDNLITTITVDQKGRKWIGTGKGIAIYDDINWQIYDESKLKLPGSVCSICVDYAGNIWVGTKRGGLVKFDGKNSVVYNLWNSNIPDNTITSIAAEKGGKIWICTEIGSLATLDGNSWQTQLSQYYPRSVVIDSKNNKWVAVFDGLMKYDNSGWIKMKYPDLISNDWFNTIISGDSNDGIWLLLNNNKLVCYSVDKWNLYQFSNINLSTLKPNSLSVRDFHLSNDNSIWISTDAGFARLKNEKWDYFNLIKPDSTALGINDFIIDKNNMFYGLSDESLVKFDGKTGEIIKQSFVSKFDYDTRITSDKAGNIWIAGKEGILKYDGITWSFYKDDKLMLDDGVVGFAIDKTDNKWIGVSLGGIIKFDSKNQYSYCPIPNAPPLYSPYKILIDENNNKWMDIIGYGLVKYDDNIWTVFTSKNSKLPEESFYSFDFDKQKNIWFFGKQMTKFNFNSIENFENPNDIFFNSTITKILTDDSGNKWILSDRYGLAVFRETGVALNVHDSKNIISHFNLEQNFPNPFNPSTVIGYSLSSKTHIRLTVYDLLGREIKTLVNGEINPGRHVVTYNASNLSSGIYFYTLEANNYRLTKKMTLIR